MARNSEKSTSLFSRWNEFRKSNSAKVGARPLFSSDVTSLPDAEKWRREAVRDINKKVTAIANASLGENRIRELNDEINKLMKKKYFWESRIVELGGTDHRKTRQYYDIEGKELPGAPGYRYYGAAKELPGVRELFQEKDREAEANHKKRTRGDIFKHITPDYYGFRDEDDGVLVAKEAAREAVLIAEEQRAWKDKTRQLEQQIKSTGGVYGTSELAMMGDTGEHVGQALALAVVAQQKLLERATTAATTAIYVPTQSQIEDEILASKKASLLSLL